MATTIENTVDLDEVGAMLAGRREAYVALADRIWETPEVCYQEWKSSAAHLSMLCDEGFRIETGVAGIPTALTGEAGSGGPVIAILGEFDALPALSQQAGVAAPAPLVEGAAGHGCGHNLLGSASLLAASIVKQWLEQTGTPGRVRYYGCPAEEGGAAKAFMVREGAFEGVDAAISWHPHPFLQVVPPISLANTRIDFAFHGRAAHAAMAPHLGRSALDAVELMSVGVNYLREHVPSTARIHYAILDAGGIAPNVVQAHARVRYAVRASSTPEMLSIVERVRKVAEGAALMTGTTVDVEVVSAVSNLMGNTVLERSLEDLLQQMGPPAYAEEDLAFAAELQKTFPAADIRAGFDLVGLEPSASPLCDRMATMNPAGLTSPGSTDVGDVSWAVPTVQLHAPTMAIGTQFHTWQVVAQGKSGIAHKGMLLAGQAMALQTIRLLTDARLLDAAKEEHRRRLASCPYQTPLPPETKPPLEMSGTAKR